MNRKPNRRASRLLSLALALTATSQSMAHFPWLATDDQGHAVMWFGESTDDRSYPMPAKVQAIELRSDGAEPTIKMSSVDSDKLVGIRSDKPIDATKELAGTVTYGLYHGMKLTYHVEHLPQRHWSDWPTDPRADAELQTVLAPAPDGGIAVAVLQNGKPLEGVDVKLFCEEGHEEAARKTDAAGLVNFTAKEVESGLNAVMVGTKSAADAGNYDGEDYTSTADYLTATFFKESSDEEAAMTKPASKPNSIEPTEPKVDESSGVSIAPSGLPDLPEELTSFGAAIAGETLFVYGGHTGNAHSYSTAEQSNRLWALDLAAGKDGSWKSLATGPALQGLALVPFKDRVIRIGGFTAVNAAGEEQDLRSQTYVASYDAASNTWIDLAPLPEARSSFDAAVVGTNVYVFGGWKLTGDSDESQWHSTGWSLDLGDPKSAWKPTTPLTDARRAISVAAFEEQLFVIGGMKPDNGTTTRVDIYDPALDTWKQGPSIPGKGMSGFGASSFAVAGDLYVSTMDGFVHRLNAAKDDWETVAKSDPARFFHRMLPYGNEQLLMIGGANMEVGKFTAIDAIRLKPKS